MEEKKARIVMIATPSIDGKVDVQYVDSLYRTLVECSNKGIFISPVFVAYDALVQRARNDLFKIAYESTIDDLIFIDADIVWEPEHVIKLLEHEVDVVGASYRKKNFNEEYVVRILEEEKVLKVGKNNLVEVSGLGTGFLRISKKVVNEIYESSPEYKEPGKTNKMVFDIRINDNGDFQSEDIVFLDKVRKLGYSIYLDPYITCSHVGTSTFRGDIMTWARANNLITFE